MAQAPGAPHLDAMFEFLTPVLWQAGRIGSIHGPIFGHELDENERGHVWDLQLNHYYHPWASGQCLVHRSYIGV